MDNKVSEVEEKPAETETAPDRSTSSCIRPQARKIHDPAVSYEEYVFYARKTREEEFHLPRPKTNWREILLRKKPANDLAQDSVGSNGPDAAEKYNQVPNVNLSNPSSRLEITDREWTDASRAFRTASWGACFYLITTDILGPYVGPLSSGQYDAGM